MLNFKLTARICLIGAIVALTLAACAQVTKSGDGYRFRRKFAVGKSLAYSEAIGFGQHPLPPNSPSILLTMKAIRVAKDGATVQVVQTVHPHSALPEKHTAVTPVNSLGLSKGPAPYIGCAFPEKPVRVGGAWNGMVQLGVGNAIHPSLKFLGIRNVKGREVALLVMDLATPKHPQVRGSGQMQVLVSDGSLYRMSLTTIEVRGNVKSFTRISVIRM